MHKILMSGLLLFASSSYGWNYHLHVYNQTGYNAHFNATTDIIDGHGGVSPMTGDIAANADQPINLSTKYQWKDLTYQARGQITVTGNILDHATQTEIPYACIFTYNGTHLINALNSISVVPVQPTTQQWEICQNMPVIRNSTARCQGHQDCIYLRGQNLVGDALSLQMQKTNHAPLNQTQWIGAHNAAISAQYSTSTSLVNVSYSDPNQYLNITQQLNDGVRFIELDLRWFNDAPILCHFHFNGALLIDDPICSGNATLDTVLPEIHRWLINHPDQLIWLYLDMGMSFTTDQAQTVTKMLADDLPVLTKNDLTSLGFSQNNLPLNDEKLTPYIIVHDLHKNVIVVTHDNDTDAVFDDASDVFTKTVSNTGIPAKALPNDISIDYCRIEACEKDGVNFSDAGHATLWAVRGDQTSLSGDKNSMVTVDDI
ncbi:MAG TPA: hypothetical protein VI844_02220, partial [Coxiellaceae bacterium]|nr:hypothetical protein [Coxiellaceae bacterium]